MFQFVFQNGEFLSDKSSFLGISLDTIFTVLTTIGIFVLGYIVNKKIESDKEKKRLAGVKEYFLKLIELLESPLNVQRDSLLKFSKQLNERKEQNFFLDDVAGLQVEQLKEIDNKDLLKIFANRHKVDSNTGVESFGKIRSKIYYIDRVKNTLGTDLKDLNNKYEKYIAVYRENIKATSDLFDVNLTYNIQHNIAPQDDSFLAALDNIRNNWVRLQDDGLNYKDMYVAKEHYLEPLMKLCKSSLDDPRSTRFIKHVMECQYAFSDIQELKYVYRKHFIIEGRGLQQSLLEIKSIAKTLK